MIALIVVCVFVALCAARAGYETRVAPSIRKDLAKLDHPGIAEEERFEAAFGERTGIRLSEAEWDGRERRTVHTRPAKVMRPKDIYDGADK